MRLSTHEDDPGFIAWKKLVTDNDIDIFLDGVEIKSVETADEELGYVLHCVLDADGNVQLHPERENEVWTTESSGRVEIKLRPRPIGIREAATA